MMTFSDAEIRHLLDTPHGKFLVEKVLSALVEYDGAVQNLASLGEPLSEVNRKVGILTQWLARIAWDFFEVTE